MNRKDIIIISVLMNTALLAVLFLTATHSEDDPAPKNVAMDAVLSQQVPIEPVPPVVQERPVEPYIAVETGAPLDEVDHVIRDYVPNEGLLLEPAQTMTSLPVIPQEEPSQSTSTQRDENQKYVEVTVKKGDVLEKIAKANATTVQAIKEANKITSDKLKIGQVLKVPVGSKEVAENARPVSQPIVPVSTGAPGDPVYYTVKSGDSPWKIAKQFGVNIDDILKLNNMTEEQARKLKIGDKIRVK